MKNKSKKWINNNWKETIATLGVLLLFFLIYRTVPMMYDGWAGKFYYPNINGILLFIKYIIVDFYSWINGRIVSNIICGILESFPSEIPLDFFNAAVMVGIYICIYNLVKDKKSKKFISGLFLFMSMILTVCSSMRTEVLFYANTAYIVPILLLLLYYFCYIRLINGKDNTIRNIIIMSIIGFSIGTWMEHIAVGFAIVISFLWVINFWNKSNARWKLLIPTIVTGIGSIIMFMSPGLRISRTIVDNTPIIDIFKNNITTFYIDIVSKNLHVFILLFIFLIILIIENKKMRSIYKALLGIPTLAITISMVLMNINRLFGIKISNLITNLYPVFPSEQFSLTAIFMVIFILAIIAFSIFQTKNKRILLYIFFICIFSLVPMCLTPNTGARISSIGFFLTVCLTTICYLEIECRNCYVKRFLTCILCFMVVISLDKTILLCRRINNVNQKRERIINNVVEKQELNEWDFSKYIILPIYNENDILNKGITPMGSFHYPHFLKAYDLDPKTKIIFSNSPIAAIANKIDDKIKVEIINTQNEKLNYMYIIQYSNSSWSNIKDIENSDWIEDDDYEYDLNGMKGYYRVRVFYKDNENSKELEGNFDILVE